MVVQCWDRHSVCKSPLETLAPWSRHARPFEHLRDGSSHVPDELALSPVSTTRGLDEVRPQSSRLGQNLPSLASESPDLSGQINDGQQFQAAHALVEAPGFGVRASRRGPALCFSPPATSASAASPQPTPHACKATAHREETDTTPLAPPAPNPPPSTAASKRSLLLLQKRRRALSDVDGVDTGNLSIKKRRLRLHLITSRLSRPFSLPATHILNREATANLPGDGKRFVKLAAYLSARRAAASAAQSTSTSHNASSVDLLRRAAILNRVRVQVVQSSTTATQIYGFAHASPPGFSPGGPSMAAAVAYHGMQLVNAARFFFPSPSASAPPAPQHQVGGPMAMQQWHHHHTPNHVRAMAGPPPVSQHYGALLPNNTPPTTTAPFQSSNEKPGKVEYNHARLPPSPKLKPSSTRGANRRPGRSPLAQSPDLRPARERDFDENDEVDNDSVAFPGSELDNRYADDSDVSDNNEDGFDFDAMFGDTAGLTPDDLDELEFEALDAHSTSSSCSNEHFYEEYLDELDGIRRPP